MERKELIEKLKVMQQEKERAELIKKEALEELNELNKKLGTIAQKINDVNIGREEVEKLIEEREEVQKKVNVVNVELSRANVRISQVESPEELKNEFYELLKNILIEQRKEQFKTTKKIFEVLKKQLIIWDTQPEFLQLKEEEQELFKYFQSQEKHYYDLFRDMGARQVTLVDYHNNKEFKEFQSFLQNFETSLKNAEQDFWNWG